MQMAKDEFLRVIADEKAKLSYAGVRFDVFFGVCILPVTQAVYRLRHLLREEQRQALDKRLKDYTTQESLKFGNGREMLVEFLQTNVTPENRLFMLLTGFEDCVNKR